MPMFMGFAGYFSLRLHQDASRSERVAKLFTDPRWPWDLTSVVYGVRSQFGKWTKRQKINGKSGTERLRDGILNPEHRDARVDHRADAEVNHAHLHIETGQRLAEPDSPFAATTTGMTRAYELPEGANLLSWVDVIHELMFTLEVGNAVLPVWPTEHMITSDTTFTRILLDTSKATYNLGIYGDFDRQRQRANYWRPELGDKYIRHPRWGTYLRRAHLDRVGGLERIRGEVPLAKILELGGAGDLVYLQCTEHPAGALTPEGEQIRQKLEEVLEPIVAPPRPQDLVTPA